MYTYILRVLGFFKGVRAVRFLVAKSKSIRGSISWSICPTVRRSVGQVFLEKRDDWPVYTALLATFQIQSRMLLVNAIPNPKSVAPKLQKLYDR